MFLEELIGRTLVFGIPGTRVTPADVRLFQETHACGLILYRINFESPAQIKRLISDLENALGRRLLVTVDHEGGRVVMFQKGVTVFPDGLAFGAAGIKGATARQGAIEARELQRMGVDVNFSPTVDVLTEAFSPNIGIRSYGLDPRRVAELATARIGAMQEHGVSACAKHFPGLGPATLDPHLDLPVIGLTWRELRRHHLPPFQRCLKAGVDIVMSSHPLYPKLDSTPRTPATFSRKLIHDLLRKELGFKGVISSDDLEMGALRNLCNVGEAAVRAVKAGHDLILCCHRADLQRKVYKGLRDAYLSGRLSVSELEKSVERIDKLVTRRPRFAGGAPRAEPAGAALARQVSRAAVSVIKEGFPFPPKSPQRPLIIFPRLSELSKKIMIEEALCREKVYLQKALRGVRGQKNISIVSIDPLNHEIKKAAAAAGRSDAVVFFCFDAHLQNGCLKLWEALRETGKPLTVVLLRDPYDVEFSGRNERVITAFGFRKCQIDACIEKILHPLPHPPPSRGREGVGGLNGHQSRLTSVAVDLGGTSFRLAAVDALGRELFKIEKPALPPRGLPMELKTLWRARRFQKIPFLIVGSKGVWTLPERRTMERGLKGLAHNVLVLSDVELAFESAFQEKEPGILLAAGTGSVALGRNARGRWARAGGLGPKRGDEGSGFWIGKEFLKRKKGRTIPAGSPETVRGTAALAPHVLSRAARDPLCGTIVREAAGHLARLVLSIRARLKLKNDAGLCLTGSLWKNGALQRSFWNALKAGGFKKKSSPSNMARFAAGEAAALFQRPRPEPSSGFFTRK